MRISLPSYTPARWYQVPENRLAGGACSSTEVPAAFTRNTTAVAFTMPSDQMWSEGELPAVFTISVRSDWLTTSGFTQQLRVSSSPGPVVRSQGPTKARAVLPLKRRLPPK